MDHHSAEQPRRHQLHVLRKMDVIKKILHTTPAPYPAQLANTTKDLLLNSISLIENTLRIMHLDHVSDGFKLNAMSRAIQDSLIKIEPILDSHVRPGWRISSPPASPDKRLCIRGLDDVMSLDDDENEAILRQNEVDQEEEMDFLFGSGTDKTFNEIGEDSTLNILQMLDFQSLATVASVNKFLQQRVEQIQWSSISISFRQENVVSVSLNSGRVRSNVKQWPFESHVDYVKQPKPIVVGSLMEADSVFQSKGHHVLDVTITDSSPTFVGLLRHFTNVCAVRFENALGTKALQALSTPGPLLMWSQVKRLAMKFDERSLGVEEVVSLERIMSSLKSLRKLTVNCINYGSRGNPAQQRDIGRLLLRCPDLENLQSLDFYGNGTDTECLDSVLASCKRLRRLCIQADRINKTTGNVIQEICGVLSLLALASEDMSSPVEFSSENAMDMEDLATLISACSGLEVLAVYMSSMELSDEFLRMGGDLTRLRELYFRCDWSSANKSILASFLLSLLQSSPSLSAVHIPVGGEFAESLLNIVCKNRNHLEAVEFGKLPAFGEDALWSVVKSCPELLHIGGLTGSSKQLFSAFKCALFLERSFAF